MKLFQVSLTGRVWPTGLLVQCAHISEVVDLVRTRVHAHGSYDFRLIRWVGYTSGRSFVRSGSLDQSDIKDKVTE